MFDVILNFARTRPRDAFRLFVATHVALWMLLPALGYTSPPLDVVELFGWGHEWRLGYINHPPLPAWLLEAAYQATGGGVWTAYLLSQLCIAATFLAVWRLARPMVGEVGALLAAVALEGVFYFTVPTPEFNHNVLQMPLWAWASLHFHRALTRPAPRYWFYLAIWVALLVYTKYSGGLLVLVFGLIALATAPGRAALKSPWPYLAALLSILLALPHLVWLVKADFLPIAYALDQEQAASLAGRLFDAIRFPAAQLLDHAPLLLVVALAVIRPRRPEAARAPLTVPLGEQSRFDRTFVAWVVLGPPLIAALMSLILGIQFRTLWGAPMFAFSGLGLLLLAAPVLTVRRPRACAALLTFYLVAIPVLHTAGLWIVPWINHKDHRPIGPAEEIGAAVSAAWT
ncbi:MAG TPA: glycosyltransferase family 39 protein, partial [Hyphomicrobiales bacterium]|nr:glycosyltransferase family 39 protein [Hyphomicrobiales bacterium]